MIEEPGTVVVVVVIAEEAGPTLNSFGPSFDTKVDVRAFCNQLDSDQTSTFLVARYPA